MCFLYGLEFTLIICLKQRYVSDSDRLPCEVEAEVSCRTWVNTQLSQNTEIGFMWLVGTDT